MGSEKRKEGLLLAVFWLAAVILIGTAANRMDAFRTVCPVFMEFMVAVPGSKTQGKKKDGSSVSSIRVAVFPVGTQYIAAAHWCRHMDGNGDGIWYLHQ